MNDETNVNGDNVKYASPRRLKHMPEHCTRAFAEKRMAQLEGEIMALKSDLRHCVRRYNALSIAMIELFGPQSL
jgi:hypothetical protein